MNKEQAILDALPGTSKHICQTCNLPQSTVSKLLAQLILLNKAFHAGWFKSESGMASMVYARGPMPEGFTLPEAPRSARAKAKPANVSRGTKEIRTPTAPHTLKQWDAENCTDHLFNRDREPFRMPEPHYLMVALYGLQIVTPKPVDEWVSTPIIKASQPETETEN